MPVVRGLLPLFLIGLPAATVAAQDDSGTKVYKRVVRSVVWVHSPRSGGLAQGSGTLIDKDRRLVLTNYHVVEDENRARVFFPAFRSGQIISEKSYYTDRIKQLAITGRVLARDKQADLSLVQINSVPEGVEAVPLAAGSPEPGQTVHAIGNAGASDALWGYVPGKVRQVYRKKWRVRLDGRTLTFEARVVETDSPTNPGDSGGPLVNDRGELVGVTQGGVQPGKANLVSTFIDVSEVRQLLGQKAVRPAPAAPPKDPDDDRPKRDKSLPIKDEASLFSAEAEKKVQSAIDELFAKNKLDVLVETYPAVREADLEKVKKMPAKEQTEYMRTWAAQPGGVRAPDGIRHPHHQGAAAVLRGPDARCRGPVPERLPPEGHRQAPGRVEGPAGRRAGRRGRADRRESGEEVTPAGLLLCDDLIFASKVTATARAAGLEVRVARESDRLLQAAREQAPTGVILDLHNPGLDLPSLLAELRDTCPAMPRVVAYGSHVEAETLRAARRAGCDRVMPRSQFVEELEAGLKEWLS